MTSTPPAEPQWRVHVSLQHWINDYAVDLGGPLGSTDWFITADEADAASRNGEALDSLVTMSDARVPVEIADHDGPFSVSVKCTGCHTEYGYSDAGGWSIDEHSDCAAGKPAGPPPQPLPDWPRYWRRAIASCTLGEAVSIAQPGQPHTPKSGGTSYTIELRFDVQADDDDHARRLAQLLADTAGGRLTAIFDETWDEI